MVQRPKRREPEKTKPGGLDDTIGEPKKSKSLRQIDEDMTEKHLKIIGDSYCDYGYDEDDGAAQPIGEVIRVSNDGSEIKKHYKSFEFDGNQFHLEDAILVAPEEGEVKPSVTTIKDIFQVEGGMVMVSGQRFYRPGEVEKEGGGTWETGDARELFYSHELDEIAAICVMHNCVIHFVPPHKPLPDRKQNPGFIVRKIYDHVQQKVRILTEKDCKTV